MGPLYCSWPAQPQAESTTTSASRPTMTAQTLRQFILEPSERSTRLYHIIPATSSNSRLASTLRARSSLISAGATSRPKQRQPLSPRSITSVWLYYFYASMTLGISNYEPDDSRYRKIRAILTLRRSQHSGSDVCTLACLTNPTTS